MADTGTNQKKRKKIVARKATDHMQTCENPACRKEFRVEPSQVGIRKCCSRSCASKARAARMNVMPAERPKSAIPAYRMVEVPGEGEFEVPTHVSRVDSRKAGGRRGWHGWQVRWPGHRKFFTDTQHGSVAASLAAAAEYVDRNYPGKNSQCDRKAGVRVIQRQKATRNFPEIYVEVSHPQRGKAARRLYVGTVRTASPEKVREKLIEGRKLRLKLIAEHKAETGTL